MSLFAPDPDQQLTTIRNRLATMIEDSGLSQQELSFKSGLSQSQLSRLISGSGKDLPVSVVIKLAPVLGFDPGQLFNLTQFPVLIQRLAYNELPKGVIPLGFDEQNNVIGYPIQDLTGHSYITGTGGESKQTMLEYLISGLAYNDQAMIVIDSGDGMSEQVINNIFELAPERSDDIVLLDFNDLEWPIGINPLSIDNYNEIDAAVSAAKEIIGNIAGLESDALPQASLYLEQAVRAICEANINVLSADKGLQLSLLEVPLFFSDAELRRVVMEFCGNTAVRETFDIDNSSFEELSTAEQQEYIAPLLSAFSSLAVQESLHNIIGQGKSFDFAGQAWQGKIILVRLPGGIGVDPKINHFIGSMIISSIARSLPSFDSQKDKPINLIIDDFENFLPQNFETILSKAKDHGLYLTLISESPADLRPENLKVINRNTANKIAFELDSDGAGLIAKQLAKTSLLPSSRDLEALDEDHFWAKINGQQALRLRSLPLIAHEDIGGDEEITEWGLEDIIERSRELAALPRDEAERSRQRHVEDAKVAMGEQLREMIMGPAIDTGKVQEDGRFYFTSADPDAFIGWGPSEESER